MFTPKGRGDSSRYFLKDEEELFVIVMEEAHKTAFPYDSDILERMVTNTDKLVYGQDFSVGKKWRLGFEKRWSKRLSKVKCGSLKSSSELR